MSTEPPVVGPRRTGLIAGIAVGVLVLVGAGAYAAMTLRGPAYSKRGSIHCIEEKGYLYTFDAVWRVEALRRIDPSTHVTAPASDPERLARLRTCLLKELKVPALEGVAVEGKAELDAVHALGY